MDPAEENDADDEGEIWYNPIPEEDEQNNSDQRSRGLTAPPRAEPQRGSSKGTDLVHGGKSLDGSGCGGPEALVESLGGGSGDASQGNAVHSTEVLHAHRQMLACKPQEEGGPSSSRPTGKAEKKDTHTFPHSNFTSCFSSASLLTCSLPIFCGWCLKANYTLCCFASLSLQIFAVVHTLSTNQS